MHNSFKFKPNDNSYKSLLKIKHSAAFWVPFLLLTIVQIIPFLMTSTPALQDYPNHLARIFIINNWQEDDFLKLYYQPNWAVLPNLAFDGLGFLLSQVLPIYAAGQAVLVLAVLLLASGLVALSASLHGKPEPFSLVGLLFIVSQPFTYGFINLILGFGLVLWGVAIWVRLRNQPLPVVLAWSVPFASLLFFAHLFAFAAYGITLACIEVTSLRSSIRSRAALGRPVLLGIAQVAVPAALFLFASPTPFGGGSTFYYVGHIQRLRSVLLAPVRNYNDAVDVATFLIVAVLLLVGFGTRRLRIAKEMRLALIVLALICPVLPDVVSTSGNAEIRLPVILSLLLAASGSWDVSREKVALTAAVLLALVSTRTLVTSEAFARSDRFVTELRGALAGVPRGSRIASVTLTTPTNHRTRAEWQHAVCYEVIEKSALVPTVFAHPAQQPLLLGATVRTQAFPPARLTLQPGQLLPAEAFANLDYLVLVNPEAVQPKLPQNLHLVAAADQFRVYRVR